MKSAVRKAMDALFWACIGVSGVSLVLISAVVPWGVYMRYVVNRAASWPEPAAILFTVVLTFFGSAACYRANLHMSVTLIPDRLPPALRRMVAVLNELLIGLLALFMVIWGARLVETTWHQVIPEFPFLAVGVTYLPIPLGGAVLLLFVLERLALGPAPAIADAGHGGPAAE